VPSDVERAVEAVVAEFGALDYGVNNAVMSGYLPVIAEMTSLAARWPSSAPPSM
jgi:NAD(P)-dependent dehydrogenase (short-subunit alcohol dehydrogenase family)